MSPAFLYFVSAGAQAYTVNNPNEEVQFLDTG
jgi:hypothetical protein